MILVICIFFLPMVAFLPASDASTISEKQHGFFPLSSSTLCNALLLCTRFLLSNTHFDKGIPRPARETEKEKEKNQRGRRWESIKLTLSSVFQALLSLFLCLKGRQTRMLKTLSPPPRCLFNNRGYKCSHIFGNKHTKNVLQLQHNFATICNFLAKFLKFKFKGVTVLVMIRNAAAGWNEPISKFKMWASVFCLFIFIVVGFAAPCLALSSRLFLSFLAVRFLACVNYGHLCLGVTSPP